MVILKYVIAEGGHGGKHDCVECHDSHVTESRTKVSKIGRMDNKTPDQVGDFDTWGIIYKACIDGRQFIMVEGKFEIGITQVFDNQLGLAGLKHVACR